MKLLAHVSDYSPQSVAFGSTCDTESGVGGESGGFVHAFHFFFFFLFCFKNHKYHATETAHIPKFPKQELDVSGSWEREMKISLGLVCTERWPSFQAAFPGCPGAQ